MFEWEILEQLYVIILKGDAKFKGKVIRGFKNDIRNLFNFYRNSQKSENLYFAGLVLSKAYKGLDQKVEITFDSNKVSVKKIQKNDLLLHQRLITTLKKN